MSDKLKKIKYNEHVQVPQTNFINKGDFMNYPLHKKYWFNSYQSLTFPWPSTKTFSGQRSLKSRELMSYCHLSPTCKWLPRGGDILELARVGRSRTALLAQTTFQICSNIFQGTVIIWYYSDRKANRKRIEKQFDEICFNFQVPSLKMKSSGVFIR